jgi:hypothetical protein
LNSARKERNEAQAEKEAVERARANLEEGKKDSLKAIQDKEQRMRQEAAREKVRIW